MRPEGNAAVVAPRERAHLRVLPPPRLRVADVALFYGERSGGIRTYLDAKQAWIAQAGAYQHHLLVPGARAVPALPLTLANGYRIPLGSGDLRRRLRELEPDVVLLHDPFWSPRAVTRAAHDSGARVVAVGHGSCELDARALPGPASVWAPLLRRWMGRAYAWVDEVMAVEPDRTDCGRRPGLPLRLGVHEAFVPRPGVARGDHVLYVGRLARQKGVFALLEAAARSREPWPLVFVGAGPAKARLLSRARELGIAPRVTVRPYVSGRDELARLYAGARCVVMPGEHETFGLVALEAAASGARVVCCERAPSARTCGRLAHTYRAGDGDGLTRAIALARASDPDPVAAAALAADNAWPSLFAAEHASLLELVRG